MDAEEHARVEQRLQVLQLLEAAMRRRDEVFAIVDSSADAEEAAERIRVVFGVRDLHIARAVLDLQVGRWTQDNRRRLEADKRDLQDRLES